MSADPPRLLDDPSLPEELHQDLADAAEWTPRYDVAAGLARFEAAIGASGGTGAGSTSHAPSTGPATAHVGAATTSAAAGIKGLVVAGLITASVGVGVWMWASRAPKESAPARPAVTAPAAPAERAPATKPASAPPITARPAEVAPPTFAPPTREHRHHARHSGHPSPPTANRRTETSPAHEQAAPPHEQAAPEPTQAAPTTKQDIVRAEIALLAETRRALAADPARALALAEQGQRQFPNGLFQEERQAIAIFALVRLNRQDQARTRASRFLARHPTGPFSERVRMQTGLAR